MRKSQIWAVLREELCNARLVGKDVRRPGLDLSEHLRMKVFDGIGQVVRFSYLRTSVNLSVKPNVRNTMGEAQVTAFLIWPARRSAGAPSAAARSMAPKRPPR